jgi:hypothetical protein
MLFKGFEVLLSYWQETAVGRNAVTAIHSVSFYGSFNIIFHSTDSLPKHYLHFRFEIKMLCAYVLSPVHIIPFDSITIIIFTQK